MERTEQAAVYRTCTVVADARFEKDGSRTVAETLVDALAAAEDVGPSELPCLYETIDLDALTRLFERQDRDDGPHALLQFTFDRWHVFVRADGRIRVCDRTRVTDPTPVFADAQA